MERDVDLVAFGVDSPSCLHLAQRGSNMKFIAWAGLVCLVLPLEQPMAAQTTTTQTTSDRYTENHAEVGIYADYFRFSPGGNATNFVGTGGRAEFNVHPNVALEAEMNYDFGRDFTTTYNNGVTSTIVRTNVRPLTGLFGPTFQFGTSGAVRMFVTGKLGFINFSTSTTNVVSGSTFTGAVGGVGDPGTHLAFYPGGGLEGFAGPLGLRIEAGDEVYLNNGTYNNLRVTAGPVFRF
jgi:hypothetical protein